MTDRPTYEGRSLPRPAEDINDQGLSFDLVTMSRRRMLGGLGLGIGAMALAACSTGSDTTTSGQETTASTTAGGSEEIPDETAGPYPGDGSNGPNVLTESGVVRSDIRSSFGGASGTAEGVPMTLTLNITDLGESAAPYVGAAVYVWHCDRAGQYSLYSEGITEENYLRGVQTVGDDGTVTFTSIFPACYTGRWPHIHFEVYPDEASITDSANAVAISQVALPQDVCETVYATEGYEDSVNNLAQISLDSDNVFGEDSAALQMATVSGDVTSGYQVTLTANVDPDTEPSGGDAPAAPGSDGGPSGAPPDGTPPGPPPGSTQTGAMPTQARPSSA